MQRYLLRRLVALAFNLLLVSGFTFAALRLIPGDPAGSVLGPNATHEQVASLIGNFNKLREALNEICAINTELLRRREDLG